MTTATGDRVDFTPEAILVTLMGVRQVVSSAAHNGGTRTDLTHLYNYTYAYSPLVQNKIEAKMESPSLQAHYARLTQALHLPVETTAGMGTAAHLEDASVRDTSFCGIKLSTIVTAGVDYNAACAGDPPSYDEFTGENLPRPGTINTMLFIDAHLPAGTATQAIITATEAKSAALHELQAGSRYSSYVATGSGTDTIMIVTRPNAPHTLYDAGHHSRLGSAIGALTKEAVKEALAHHAGGMSTARQCSLLWQGFRYGITPKSVSDECLRLKGVRPQPSDIDTLLTSSRHFAYIAPLLHLRDQYQWGILPEAEYRTVLHTYLSTFCTEHGVPPTDSILTAIAELICTEGDLHKG